MKTIAKAQEVAEELGKPYGKIITTTPNDLNVQEGKFCHDLIREAAVFSEDLYDWTREKVVNYIDANSTNDFIYIEFSYKELGHDRKWFRTQCRNLFNDLRLIKRELLLEWLQSNDTSPFTEEQLEGVMNLVKDPVGNLFVFDVYKFVFYDSLDPDLTYIIGIDVAGGLQRDDTAISIIHPETLKVIGHFRNNKIDSVDLTKIILYLAIEIIPNCVIVPERNTYGKAIIDNLLRTPVANKLYYEFREVKAEQRVSDGRIVKSKTKTKVYGINTDKASREIMINEILRHVINSEPECIVDKTIYNDIKNLERKKTGRIEHRDGEKDDGLFSYLVGRYAVSHGTNIARFIIGRTRPKGMSVEEYKENLNSNVNFVSSMNRPKTFENSLSESIIEEHMANRLRADVTVRKESNQKSSFFSSILGMNDNNVI